MSDSAELLFSAVEHSDLGELTRLFNVGVDMNIKNNDGNTPLHMACIRGNNAIAEFLLENGADIYSQNNNGWTPIDIARRERHLELLNSLLEKETPTLFRLPSSRYADQGLASTCSIHCCSKLIIRFMKTFLATGLLRGDFSIELSEDNRVINFIDYSTDEVFQDGNPCNVFYFEDNLKASMNQNLESNVFTKSVGEDRCTSHSKELIHVILYKYIFTLLLNKFKDQLNLIPSEIRYIFNFLSVMPTTVEIINEVIGFDYAGGHHDDPAIDELRNAIDDVVTILTFIKEELFDKSNTGNARCDPFLSSLDLSNPTSFHYERSGSDETNYFLNRSAFYQEEEGDESEYMDSSLHDVLWMIKTYIIDNGYYCTILVRTKDRSLNHYFTLEDIRHESIIMKDSYGEYDSYLYSILGATRKRGVVIIPIDRLLECMEYIETFTIDILSVDEHLIKNFKFNGYYLNKTEVPLLDKRNLLCDALVAKYYTLCNALLDSVASPVILDIVNEKGLSPFILSTRDPGANAITKKMIEMGANVTAYKKTFFSLEETPIANIAMHDRNADGRFENIELIQLIVANFYVQDKTRSLLKKIINFETTRQLSDNSSVAAAEIWYYRINTALKFAIYRNNVELCRLLIENGAIVHEENVDYTSRTIVFAIQKIGIEPEIIKMILKKNPLTKEVLNSPERKKLDDLAKLYPGVLIGGNKRKTQRKMRTMQKKSIKKSIFSCK